MAQGLGMWDMFVLLAGTISRNGAERNGMELGSNIWNKPLIYGQSLLKPWVILRTNGTVEVAHCTCMAGSAETCSHIGAILHMVETAVLIRNNTPCISWKTNG